jgi:hypothetical protein
MRLGKWHSGKETPKSSGWYLRDYRNTNKQTKGECPTFSVDNWLMDGCGGFWYVQEGGSINDAWFTDLPWCKIKELK